MNQTNDNSIEEELKLFLTGSMKFLCY